jgi:hypothetical protein
MTAIKQRGSRRLPQSDPREISDRALKITTNVTLVLLIVLIIVGVIGAYFHGGVVLPR